MDNKYRKAIMLILASHMDKVFLKATQLETRTQCTPTLNQATNNQQSICDHNKSNSHPYSLPFTSHI